MTGPAGSEDAGLVLSAEERGVLAALLWRSQPKFRSVQAAEETAAAVAGFLGGILAARQVSVASAVEAARAEERERIAAAIEAKVPLCYDDVLGDAARDAFADAARIARTPPPAGDAQGSQEARNGPVSDGDAGDGRGHGRDDESGRGADSQ